MKKLFYSLLLVTFTYCNGVAAGDPVYTATVKDLPSLRRLCEPFLSMTMTGLIDLVPPQGGFYFSGSPLTTQGAQENNLSWEPSLGMKVKCKFTGELLPNEKFPENGFQEVSTPSGKKQRFHYYEDPNGKKYYFEARRWYEQRVLMEQVVYNLAQLYRADPVLYKEAGLRAAAILKRFAEVYPDYVIKYDYPGHAKQFISAPDYEKASHTVDHHFVRLTRWYWWGYGDISRNLLLAYDQLTGTPAMSVDDDRAVVGLFDAMIAFADHFDELPLTNMHPHLWETQSIAARVLRRPGLAEKVLKGLGRILEEQYTYDGFYKEATVSYSNQTVLGLKNVLLRLYPGLSKEQFEQKIRADYPDLYRTFRGNEAFRLPNGHYAAINDTWATDRYSPVLSESRPALMPGMGHAVLGFGAGEEQLQAHLNFSGRYGHDHYGSLGLILFARGKELLSDIGYTHTKARTWSASTAAHSTVVVDAISQAQGRKPRNGMGDLLLYQVENPGFQVVEAGAGEVYPERVSDYRRTLVAVQEGAVQYVIDLFHVKGGSRHDWLLHGSADEQQKVDVVTTTDQPLRLQPVPNLLPEGYVFEELQEQGHYEKLWEKDWAFGYFKNVLKATTSAGIKATFRYTSEPDLGLQTWLMGGNSQEVSTVRSWNIRGAKEEQGALGDHLRASVVVRRPGEYGKFAAVHVPFKGIPAVRRVQSFEVGDEAVALRIDHQQGTDYLLYQSTEQPRTVRFDGQKFELNGRIALVQLNSNHAVKKISTLRTSASKKLIGFEKETIRIEGQLEVTPGAVVRVSHGDGHVTAFHVRDSKVENGTTLIGTREPVFFEDIGNGALKLNSFPFPTFQGPHTVVTDMLQSK